MDDRTLDEMLAVHLRREVTEAEPPGDHPGYALLRRAALGEELKRDDEIHLDSCAQCAAIRDKFAAEYRLRASENWWQRLSAGARRAVAGLGGLAAVGALAALLVFVALPALSEAQLSAGLLDPNTPVSRLRELGLHLGLDTTVRSGGGDGSRDFTILPSDPLTPPGQAGLPKTGLKLFVGSRLCIRAGQVPPVSEPPPAGGWPPEQTWRIEGPGMAPVGGRFFVLNDAQVARLRERERRLAGNRDALVRLHALYHMDSHVEREIEQLPADARARLRQETDALRPGLFRDLP